MFFDQFRCATWTLLVNRKVVFVYNLLLLVNRKRDRRYANPPSPPRIRCLREEASQTLLACVSPLEPVPLSLPFHGKQPIL